MLAGPLLSHYRGTLTDIREAGFVKYWAAQFRPYLRSAAAQIAGTGFVDRASPSESSERNHTGAKRRPRRRSVNFVDKPGFIPSIL